MAWVRWPVTVMCVLAMSVAACRFSGEPPTTMSGGNAGSNVVLTDVSLVEAVESSVVTVTLRQLQPDELGDAMEVPAGAGLGERCRCA